MGNNELEELRRELDALSNNAKHGVTDDAVIPDDDPEVIELMKPWDDRVLAEQLRRIIPTVDGRSMAEAKQIVAERNRDRALYAPIVDESNPQAERLAAVERLLRQLGPRHYLSQFSAAELIRRIRPANELRIIAGGERIHVQRPPRELADVWEI